MRRLHALLMAAGLAVVPSGAVAQPDEAPTFETFEWSTSSRARLGIMVIGLTPELRKHFGAAGDRGVLVGRVEPKSPAAAAGIAVGDVLVEVQGTPISAASDVLTTLGSTTRSDSVGLTVIRAGKPLTLTAKVPKASPRMPPGEGATTTREPPMPSWFRDFMDSFRSDQRTSET